MKIDGSLWNGETFRFADYTTVKSIGDQAFYNDSTIAVVTMREGLETIGNEVFWNNSGVRSFVIPGTVQTIGTNSFYGCTNTSTLRFKDGDGILTIDTKKNSKSQD
ncbi:MAG: leucine-rich repeat protein [Prevotella sp.]